MAVIWQTIFSYVMHFHERKWHCILFEISYFSRMFNWQWVVSDQRYWNNFEAYWRHYSDVIMSVMASQITGISIDSSTVCTSADQRKIKAPRHWPLWGEFTGNQRANYVENVSIWFHHDNRPILNHKKRKLCTCLSGCTTHNHCLKHIIAAYFHKCIEFLSLFLFQKRKTREI